MIKYKYNNQGRMVLMGAYLICTQMVAVQIRLRPLGIFMKGKAWLKKKN